MKNTSHSKTLTYLRCIYLLAFSGLSFHLQAQPIQFEYDLKITADPAKRAAYLKASGEDLAPTNKSLV